MHGVITEICFFYGRVKKTKTFLKVVLFFEWVNIELEIQSLIRVKFLIKLVKI